MRILISVSHSLIFTPPDGTVGEHTIEVRIRRSDWGLRGLKAKFHHFAEAWRIGRESSKFDALILCNVNIEAIVIAALRSLIRPAKTVVIYDLLTPRRSRLVQFLYRLLSRIDGIVVIRSGDIATIKSRFNYPGQRCRFIPFPAPSEIASRHTDDLGYVYSAGWAHRDWHTLIASLQKLPFPAKISPGQEVQIEDDARHIEILPMQSPENGRKLMAGASIVVLSMSDTELPSGPLVLLDAMTMGKAIVATEVNGTRDYVKNDFSAVVIPPNDELAMSAAIQRLMSNTALRIRLGTAAREMALKNFTLEKTMHQLIAFTFSIANLPSTSKR